MRRSARIASMPRILPIRADADAIIRIDSSRTAALSWGEGPDETGNLTK